MTDDFILNIQNLTVTARSRLLLNQVTMGIPCGGVFGLVGPSGAGKSTLLKSLNRLIQLTPGITVAGNVKFKGECIYHRSTDPDKLRTQIGMLFQQPVVFPTSIVENVLFGVKRLGILRNRDFPSAVEQALGKAALWDEVKDRLNSSAQRLSIGQQQRLCLARTLICRPEVILMDEPTSALDSRSTAAIEELIQDLKTRHTIVLVTHQLTQAARVCDRIALLDAGIVIVHGAVDSVLNSAELKSSLV